ncbi:MULTISPECIES: ribosome maturation factor RimP [Acidiphilium]|jgi:ribosome maturation factor RimP|uniref:Ribosome maturation factor RimP n=1 Tax=Acidiphilium rubrum TaxID=526 RepID=A0A8G2CMK8_ACIRU|nr:MULTISPECIES: ribosome maturation factor RimP [Acidiphilium]SIR25385.1 ribosome maturation factor RimP [Acidiphilium rubrum]HQT85655.1 ribosome maturation factor RimP [Acidiphilium rubrum]
MPSLNQTRPQHTGLEGRIADLIAPGLESIGYELVRVTIMGKQTPTVQIMADRADQTQLSLDDCERISHLVSAVLDVDDPISSAWTLEVSSTGIDRPLTRVKDWNRFAGHLAKIEMDVPIAAGRKRVTATVLSADDTAARVKLDTGETVDLPHHDIRKAKLVLTEDLIKATETPSPPN